MINILSKPAHGKAKKTGQEVKCSRSFKLSAEGKENLVGYFFLLPWFTGLLLLTVGPMLSSLYLSFTNFNLLSSPKWVGAQNYLAMVQDPRWFNTYLPLIVPKFLATDTFFIFLLVQFIRAIPRDLDDAAKIDGCSHVQMYLRIILPLSTPALATTAIFTFIWTWSDFFTQLIFLDDQASYTVPVALRTFLDSSGVSASGQLFAISVISLIPILGFFIAFQRLLLEGVVTSGIKG